MELFGRFAREGPTRRPDPGRSSSELPAQPFLAPETKP